MPTAIVNYHIKSAERQAFQIDAGGVIGALIAPVLVPTKVDVLDERSHEVPVTFAKDSVGFTFFPTQVKAFNNNTDWNYNYNKELQQLLKNEVRAKEVVVFDHTLRIDDETSDRQPARNVHSDYSAAGAKQRVKDILGEARAIEWSTGDYAFINIWRPVESTILSAPLGFVLPSTVRDEDWLEIDLVYPNRTGQIMGLVSRDTHQWIYRSEMTTDEVAYFNIYDSSGKASVAHSALDLIESPRKSTVRTSLESRTLVRY